MFQAIVTGPATLVGAGDIARCGSAGAELTARLLDRIAGTVVALGDIAYMSGTEAEFRECYDPTWGRHLRRTRPVPGNHEYLTPGAAGYFSYFGANAGPAGLGYYSYSAGSWHVVALNSEVPIDARSPQIQWLREELARHPSQCTVVYWHRPLFSSGPNGSNPDVRELWRVLYDANVDIVMNGHDHLYERFAPQDADGRPDAARGIRQFTVGTGGVPPYGIVRSVPNSEATASAWGVIVLTLDSGSYQWEFVPAEGESFRDGGIGTCH